MVSVFGTTYRIVERSGIHEIVRLLDDQSVGTFRQQPTLAILQSSLEPLLFATVVREALCGGKLAWRPEVRSPLASQLRQPFAKLAGLRALIERLLRAQPVLESLAWLATAARFPRVLVPAPAVLQPTRHMP